MTKISTDLILLSIGVMKLALLIVEFCCRLLFVVIRWANASSKRGTIKGKFGGYNIWLIKRGSEVIGRICMGCTT